MTSLAATRPARPPEGPAPDAQELPFDVVAANARVPALRPGSISRTALVNRLRAARSVPVVTIVAPGGYGKTTLLAQWAARDARRFAWVTVDERDEDAATLLRHVAAALHRIEPLDASVIEALRSPGRSIWTKAVPRLAAALSSFASPLVLVLDDASSLRSKDSIDAVTALGEHIPAGSTLVLAGRAAPPAKLTALRARGRLLELDRDSLALTAREAELLVRAAGVGLDGEQIADLQRRTEGWAAGLYLAALALRDGVEPAGLGGGDRYLTDYFRSEILARLSPRRRAFLRRTAVLDRLCGSLCDEVLGRSDSALTLESLDDANVFVAPLDRHREWYRCHGLLRDVLRHELAQQEPELVAALNLRAACWFEARGNLDEAIDHADAAGDVDRVARLLAAQPPTDDTERRLDRFAAAAPLERYPAIALHGAWVYALRGRAADARRWLGVGERAAPAGSLPDGCTPARAWIALIRAALCRDGVDRMRSDAELAVRELPADNPRRPTALLLQGVADALLGEEQRADAILADAADEAEAISAAGVRVAAIAQRALLAAGRDDDDAVDTLVFEAGNLGPAGDCATAALMRAVSVRALLRRGRRAEAHAALDSSRGFEPLLTCALPWLSVQTWLELTRAYLAVGDADAARALLARVEALLERRPSLGVLSAHRGELRREVDLLAAARGSRSTLTAAELLLLPLLATHLTFRDIATRRDVSRNTIKTQAISVYRKLGVSSRGEAIEAAARLGLVRSAIAS